MGANKAFLDSRGQTLLKRALTALSAVCGSVTIVGDPETFANHGPVVADLFPGCGPLAGIHSALVHSSAELNLVLAVDMPFVSQELLRFLLGVAENTNAVVTVPRTSSVYQKLRDNANFGEAEDQIRKDSSPGGTTELSSTLLQPLCAVYRRAFAVTAEQALKAGKYKIDATFANVQLRVIEEPELAAAGFSEKNFFNLNTPEDRHAADDLSSQGV